MNLPFIRELGTLWNQSFLHHLVFIPPRIGLEVPKPLINLIWHYFQNNVILREQCAGETLFLSRFAIRPVMKQCLT